MAQTGILVNYIDLLSAGEDLNEKPGVMNLSCRKGSAANFHREFRIF